MLREVMVHDGGRILWRSWDTAVEYARARHLIHHKRQQVRHVVVDGTVMWHVRCVPAGGAACT